MQARRIAMPPSRIRRFILTITFRHKCRPVSYARSGSPWEARTQRQAMWSDKSHNPVLSPPPLARDLAATLASPVVSGSKCAPAHYAPEWRLDERTAPEGPPVSADGCFPTGVPRQKGCLTVPQRRIVLLNRPVVSTRGESYSVAGAIRVGAAPGRRRRAGRGAARSRTAGRCLIPQPYSVGARARPPSPPGRPR